MTKEIGGDQKRRFGYGGSHRKGREQDLEKENEIGAVFGGQVWMFRPDKQAKVAPKCSTVESDTSSILNLISYTRRLLKKTCGSN